MPVSRLRGLLEHIPELPRNADLELDFTLRQQAGVAVVLRPGVRVELLFIKRARNPRDPWSGHIALPGGRREPDDADLLATAIRETREETGIALAAEHFIGRLPKVAPRGPTLPPVVVVPFLFAAPPGSAAVVEPAEVERAGWVSLDHLRTPGTLVEHVVEMPAGRRTFPGYRVGDDVIWGMTYRIVEDLLLTLDGERIAGL